jgi:acyl dehydratase
MTQMFAPQSTGWAGTRRGAPKVGASATLTCVVTRHDIAAFAGMTGDRNPIHFDDVLASATQLGRPVVQGGVSSGLLNALVATHLPGPGTVFLGVRWRFPRPVHPGERITARVEVLSVREDKPICSLATIVSNEAGRTVIEGTASTFTLPLPEAALHPWVKIPAGPRGRFSWAGVAFPGEVPPDASRPRRAA